MFGWLVFLALLGLYLRDLGTPQRAEARLVLQVMIGIFVALLLLVLLGVFGAARV